MARKVNGCIFVVGSVFAVYHWEGSEIMIPHDEGKQWRRRSGHLKTIWLALVAVCWLWLSGCDPLFTETIVEADDQAVASRVVVKCRKVGNPESETDVGRPVVIRFHDANGAIWHLEISHEGPWYWSAYVAPRGEAARERAFRVVHRGPPALGALNHPKFWPELIFPVDEADR